MENPLYELMIIGTQKKYEFNLKIVEEKHNIVDVNNETRTIYVELGLPESEDLSTIIQDAITKVV